MNRLRGSGGLPLVGLRFAWRSARTILLAAALALASFLLATVLIARAEPPGWVAALLPLYVLAGTLVGAYVGLLTALSRETEAMVSILAGHLGSLSRRALDGLALPEGAIDPARLRRVAQARLPSSRGRRATRAAVSFGVSRAIELAGLSVLRERLIALADDAERRGSPVVARDAVEAVAREGIGAAVAARLSLGWAAARMAGLVIGLALLLSLPLATVLLD